MFFISECDSGWIKIGPRCYQLLTDYSLIPAHPELDKPAENHLSYEEATIMCQNKTGQVASVTDKLFENIKNYLRIWKHDYSMGDVWIASPEEEEETCEAIKVILLVIRTLFSYSKRIICLLSYTNKRQYNIVKCVRMKRKS